MALSRFGTFSGLGQTHSSSTDVYPDTATLSFHGATYTSQYLSFQGVETRSNQPQGNGYAPLDTPTVAQQNLLKTFDAPPYVPSGSAGSIPFIDFANQAVISGASYNSQLLAGKTADQIAAALSDPSDPITKAIGGTANAFTTLLCQLTKGQPGAGLVGCGGGGGSHSGTGGPTGASSVGSPATSATAAGTAVTATEADYSIALSTTTFAPGTYTFNIHNQGKFPHDLNVKGPGVDGQASPTLDPGSTGRLTVTLQKGSYELWCSVDGHKDRGMDMTIQVS